MANRILLIEDDKRLAEMVQSYLGEAGFRTTIAPTGAGGIALHGRETFDALILDLMLPDMDGLDVCRTIRERAPTPILMLTARGDAMDRVVGLELGRRRLLAETVRAARIAGAPESNLAPRRSRQAIRRPALRAA